MIREYPELGLSSVICPTICTTVCVNVYTYIWILKQQSIYMSLSDCLYIINPSTRVQYYERSRDHKRSRDRRSETIKDIQS